MMRNAEPPVSPDLQAEASLPALPAPTATVVICNFNYARYLGRAIESALRQTLPCQVLVVDDGSTDGSRDLLAQVDSRVQVVLQENGGQLAAYETGLKHARGDLVLFLDADDELDAEALAKTSTRFEAGVAKVHFRLRIIDHAGKPSGVCLPSLLGRGNVRQALVRSGVLYPSPPGSGNVYRRAVLERLFPLPQDAGDKIGADFFTIYGSVALGDVAACDEALGSYRLHRQPQQAGEQLVFGNAALGNDEAAKVETRYRRLADWVAARTAGRVHYAPTFLDFSVLKSSYAMGILGQPYRQALRRGFPALRRLLRSLWLQPEYPLGRKLGLSAWSFLVLLAPRPAALAAARHVCNPASRRA